MKDNRNSLNEDIVVSDFNDYIMHLTFRTITIYNKDTKDYKGRYVARLFDKGIPLKIVCLADTVEELRKIIPSQMVCFKRNEEDDPVIIETWV